jgi:hypothetical protein
MPKRPKVKMDRRFRVEKQVRGERECYGEICLPKRKRKVKG